MSRLIDADALWMEIIHRMDYCDDILEIIEAMPTVPQWIPVTEHTPEDGIYLVYAPNYTGGSSSAKEWHNGVMFSAFKNGKWSIEHGYYKRPGCVKAYMPLPEPYREAGDRT